MSKETAREFRKVYKEKNMDQLEIDMMEFIINFKPATEIEKITLEMFREVMPAIFKIKRKYGGTTEYYASLNNFTLSLMTEMLFVIPPGLRTEFLTCFVAESMHHFTDFVSTTSGKNGDKS